ncbi:hypothetical protein IFM89_008301 [Coptis chinensis]|uniref:Uncharacterized protein n=1 Tax=Coptis chinensis TaxID=261450 RepID=A0A835IA75_9MAGN|nr:hypothetical protein IFM89_008301 [Coptis chinensis]
MSNKQVQKFGIAEALLEQESSSNSKLDNELSEVKSTVRNLLTCQARMETLMAGILENMRHNGSTNGQPCMHTTEVDSTYVCRTQQVPNLNPPSRLSSNPNVKILRRKGEHVANGYVKTDNKKCHFRDIVGDEKVVYVTNVLVGDAPMYDGPHDDIAYLRYIATRGFLIWAGGSGMKPQVASTGPTPEWDEGICFFDTVTHVSSGLLQIVWRGSKDTHEYHWLGAVHVKDVANAQVLLFQTPSASGSDVYFSEKALIEQAFELRSELENVASDISGLFSKIERKDKLEDGNRTLVHSFQSRLIQELKVLLKTVVSSFTQQEQKLREMEGDM